MPDHIPTREAPWLRVADADGNHLDRHYQDPAIADGTFVVIEGYPVNDSTFARPTTMKADLATTGRLTGKALAAALEAAGLTDVTKDYTADEKRAALTEYEATHAPDPAQEG